AMGSLTVNVTLNQFGIFQNLGSATFSNGMTTFPVVSNTTSTVFGAAIPEVVLTATAPAVTGVAAIAIQLDYVNVSAVTAKSPVLTYGLPQNVTFVSASGGGALANGVVKWTLADLAAGASG